MNKQMFLQYAAIVEREFGIRLPAEKKALLESRLLTLFRRPEVLMYFHDAASFLRFIHQDKTGMGIRMLSEAITTHHTFFMREKEHFVCFRDRTIPWLEKAAGKQRDLRVWCAACSTGEEAYTLAMLLADHFALKGSGWEKTLLATDLSQEVLQKAASGIYPASAVETLPTAWQHIYFHHRAGKYEAVETLRRAILFRQFNLMTPVFPFQHPFQVIFCRNVMIYFDYATRRELVRKFYDALVPGGWLFIGQSENITKDMAAFRYIEPSVYRKPSTTVEDGSAVKTAAARRGALRLIAIGASTGGTEAISTVLSALAPPLPPIVIVQHIPPVFSQMFAERLNEEGNLSVKEAENGEHLLPDHVYIAPGDKHMQIKKTGALLSLMVQRGAMVNGHCPSVDVLFHSVAVLGSQALGIILTGMGEDGARGLLAMRTAGASTIGQNEKSSVVYGMPRVAKLMGAVERELPLAAVAGAVRSLVSSRI
jgi:chemotaxis methyl-accepting protein methylase